MTTPGGDDGAGGASDTSGPADVVRRGPDWLAALAWGTGGLIVIVIAGLAAVGFRNFAPHWPAIRDVWTMAILDAVETDRSLPTVEPLPGVPPGTGSVAAADRDADDAGRVVTDPAWLVRPQGEFPISAMRQGIESGRVLLTCPVSASGHIQSCWIVSETPEGAGFGQAALDGAVQSRLRPRTVDGVAVDAVISFTSRFEME